MALARQTHSDCALLGRNEHRSKVGSQNVKKMKARAQNRVLRQDKRKMTKIGCQNEWPVIGERTFRKILVPLKFWSQSKIGTTLERDAGQTNR